MAGPIILRVLALVWFLVSVVATAGVVREGIFDGWTAAVAIVGVALAACAFVVLAEIAEDVRRVATRDGALRG